MDLDGDRTWERAPRALDRVTLGGTLVLGDAVSEPQLLTGPGIDIWELLSTPIREVDLIDTLCERYEVDAATVGADIGVLLAQLLELQLVRQT